MAIPMHNGVIKANHASLVDYSGEIIKFSFPRKANVGTYHTLGSTAQKALVGGFDGTVDIEGEINTGATSIYNLIRLQYEARTKKTYELSTPDAATGSFLYSGGWVVESYQALDVEAGKGDVQRFKATLKGDNTIVSSIVA
jgi:hypothetical protein